jgi:NADH-ubiquinone oxidoreductase chain 4
MILGISLTLLALNISNNLVIKLINSNRMLDYLNVGLLYLTILVFVLIILASYFVVKLNKSVNLYLIVMLILRMVLLLRFITRNYFQFYFFFESTLVPTLILISGWGLQSERLQAGLYFIFYTLRASLPLLLILIYYYIVVGRM